jgi:undecaprenyl diphosphate synthase
MPRGADPFRRDVPPALPRHIAIIMDGNGRWARSRHLPRVLGHRAGARAVRLVVEECARLGIEVLSLYAFSAENWARPAAEVEGLFKLLVRFIQDETPRMNAHGIRFMVSGDDTRLRPEVRRAVAAGVSATAANTGMVLNLCVNYGARQEILRAVNGLLAAGARAVDEASFAARLYSASLPDPDLLIRTSGEQRLSNFMLWQAAYTELYFSPKLWPDFTPADLRRAIAEYGRRHRRFGGLQDA